MHLQINRTILAATAILALSGAPAFAEQMNFTASLTAADEVPPTDSTGTGDVQATLDTDTMTFNWTITYSGLTGPATAAHFHGPADPGNNAPPVVPISGALDSPITGSQTLTAEQVKDLEAGKWYFNVHTAKYPDGEIRGQLAQGGDGAMSGGAMSSGGATSNDPNAAGSNTTTPAEGGSPATTAPKTDQSD